MGGRISRAIVITDCDPYCNDAALLDNDPMTRATSSTTAVGDFGSSGSRFAITGSSETEAGVTAGINLEYGQSSDGPSPTVRHANVFFGGEFGTLKLGHTSEAADGTTYHDQSKVWGVGHGQETGDSIAAKYVTGMGGSRNEGVHFSSASYGPASFALSVSNGDRYSAKFSLKGDVGVGAYSGSLAYLNTGSYEEVAGGLGIKLASGVTWSVAGGTQSDGKDGRFVQTDVGYVFGPNAVRLSWYGSTDITPTLPTVFEGKIKKANANHDHALDATRSHGTGDGTAIGVGFQHTMAKSGVTITAAVQQYSADATIDGSMREYDDTVALIGAVITF